MDAAAFRKHGGSSLFSIKIHYWWICRAPDAYPANVTCKNRRYLQIYYNLLFLGKPGKLDYVRLNPINIHISNKPALLIGTTIRLNACGRSTWTCRQISFPSRVDSETRLWPDARWGSWQWRCGASCLWWWTCWTRTPSPAPSAGPSCKALASCGRGGSYWPLAAVAPHLQD